MPHRIIRPGTPCTKDSSSLGARRRLQQYNAAGTLARVRLCCGSDTPPSGPEYENMTPFTIPEVINVFQRRQRKTESQPQATRGVNLLKFGRACGF